MIWLCGGIYLVGVAVCIPLFFDKDDPWGIAFALLWPLLLLGAVGVLIIGVAQHAHMFFFGPTLPPEDSDG
jgi:hypothetical protein